LGSERYGHEIDVWSAGCILYEMITRRVLFQSVTDNVAQELNVIFQTRGMPDPEVWKSWEKYPNYPLFSEYIGQKNCTHEIPFSTFLERTIPESSKSATDLLLKMLDYDTTKRIGLNEILNHPYLNENSEKSLPNQLSKLILQEVHSASPKVVGKGSRSRVNCQRVKAELVKPNNIC
jgi:serine/threonine protein kinase